MNILLTGGAGYIGSHTAVELLNAGHSIIIVDNLSNSSVEAVRRVEKITGKEIPFYQVDVCDKMKLAEIFSQSTIDGVIHFAGLKSVGESVSKPIEYYRNNIDSTLSLLEVMKEHSVNKLVFSSSATVYGNPETLPLNEDSRVGVGITNPYGWTKYMNEVILRDLSNANEALEVTLLRYFNPVGAHPGGLIGGPEQTGTRRCEPHGRTFGYLLHDGSAEGGPRITVLQGDIRAIQLAKSALYAGARLLMDEMGVDTVDRVTLAGAFGAHISPKHAMVLGMIPDVPLDKVTSAGNAAGTGARIALCSVAARDQIEGMVHDIHKVETAIEPRFQEHFVNANAIPHAVDPFPNLHQIVQLPAVSFNPKSSGDEGGRRRRRG